LRLAATEERVKDSSMLNQEQVRYGRR